MSPVKILTYGSGSNNDISFPSDYLISNVHCQIIQYDDGHYNIVDFDSSSGTWVNGQRIQANVNTPLVVTDEVKIGDVTLDWVGDFSKEQQSKGTDIESGSGIERKDNCCDSEMKNEVFPLVVFLCGLLSLGFIVYIVINYFSSFVLRLGVTFGGNIAILKLFPHYLRGYYITHGQWFPMISAVVLGFLANLLDFMTGEKDNKLTRVGQWLGDASITIGLIFIIMAFTAKFIQF